MIICYFKWTSNDLFHPKCPDTGHFAIYYTETGRQHGEQNTVKAHSLETKYKCRSLISTKRGLLLVFRFISLASLVWILTSMFDKYLQTKKQEIIYMNMKTRVLLLFSICYTNHSQIGFVNPLYARLFKNNFLENFVINILKANAKVKRSKCPIYFLLICY